MVKDVGDGEVVVKGADDENERGQSDGPESGNAGAARRLAQALGTLAEHRSEGNALGRGSATGKLTTGLRGGLLEGERDRPGEERVDAQSQS